MSGYAELQAASNFSFLRGASTGEQLMLQADALGVAALGVADRNTLAGVVRPWAARKKWDLKVRPLTGARLDFADGTPSVLCYPTDREAYGRLTRLLTLGQRRAKKAECILSWADFLDHAEGQATLVLPPARPDEPFAATLDRMAGALRGSVWLAASRTYAARDIARLARLAELARTSGAPMLATGEILYHHPDQRLLQDVITCIREGCTIHEAGYRLEANAERHLKPPAEMARLFRHWPAAVERTLEVAERIGFDLGQLRYEYPDEPVPPGSTAMEHLTRLAWEGAAWRYPDGVPEQVKTNIRTELALIEKLDYPNYFLTVHDIVRWAREQGILCQGRGSAANSSVCYCLGVTAVDPVKHTLLFTRFISENRDEPPDIDVDFEHERREEVMQYVYRRYGRDRAALVATVIHYRPRSAIRQVGKALGLTEDVTALLANTVWGSWGGQVQEDHIRQTGLDPQAPRLKQAIALATQLLGFPRHLSQHVGGYVLTKRRLDETVPIGNAAMDDRTFIEWDKDDIDALGLMKVDVLALGMLTALQKGMTMLRQDHGQPIDDLTHMPDETVDPEAARPVYEMLSRADSIGVFQVESRAQMSMLPRLKPREFYDLVIEVAIVRPGPIQGDMVHPYLKRREGTEWVNYPGPLGPDGRPEMEGLLGKTYGVPLFQEQAMRLAIEAAGFKPDEADGLRKAMATFRNLGVDLVNYETKLIEGMVTRGYEREFAERCFRQIEGFSHYGFPESHAASFAKLVWASAWMKHYWPDVFCAALLNSQPMGFYQPAQLVRDARAHGVEVRAPDALASAWDCTLEPASGGGRLKAVRLGLRLIKGLKRAEIEQVAPKPWEPLNPKQKRLVPVATLAAAREAGARTPFEFARAGVSRRTLELLAEADAFRSQGLPRREALWAVKGLSGEHKAASEVPLVAGLPLFEAAAALPPMGEAEHVAEDYRTTRLSLKAHPCEFFRPLLRELGCIPAGELASRRDGARLAVGGLVLIRQRPGTAKGVVFLTLEDETGPANVVVWADRFEANRRVAMSASFLVVHGRLQKAGEGEHQVIHLVAERFTDLTDRIMEMKEEGGVARPSQEVRGRLIRSRDFH